MGNQCEGVRECGAPTDELCTEEDFFQEVSQPYVVPYETPDSDDRGHRDVVRKDERRVALVLAAVAAAVAGFLAQVFSERRPQAGGTVRAWAQKEAEKIPLSLSDFFLMVLSSILIVTLCVMLGLGAFRLEADRSDESWQVPLAVALTVMGVFFMIRLMSEVYSWRATTARLCEENARVYMDSSRLVQLGAFVNNLDSASTGRWYLYYTVLGDVGELISQSSAILAKSKGEHFTMIVQHVVLLLVSLVLGTICVIMALWRRDSTWCMVKMMVDSVADVAYLVFSFGSEQFAKEFGVAFGFAFPALFLGIRAANLVMAVLQIYSARLMLEFIDRHKGHGTYDERHWLPRARESLADAANRVTSVKKTSPKLPIFVFIVYSVMIVVAASILKPPEDYLDRCAAEVGGSVYYQYFYPQVVTADGLLEEPRCDFSMFTEFEFDAVGLCDLPEEVARILRQNNVTKLTLRDNGLLALPRGLETLTTLKTLDLSRNFITHLDMSRLPSDENRTDETALNLLLDENPIFTDVDLSDQLLRDGRLPKGFTKWFPMARKVNLRNVGLTTVEIDEFPKMVNIEELDVSENGGFTPIVPMPPKMVRFAANGCPPFRGIQLRQFAGVSGIDWENMAASGGHLNISLESNFVMDLSVIKAMNVTINNELGSATSYYASYDFRHSSCSDASGSCAMPGLPRYLVDWPLTAVKTFSFDGGLLDYSWTPEMARDMIEVLKKRYVFDLRFYGTFLSKLKASSGSYGEELMDALGEVGNSARSWSILGDTDESAEFLEVLTDVFRRKGNRLLENSGQMSLRLPGTTLGKAAFKQWLSELSEDHMRTMKGYYFRVEISGAGGSQEASSGCAANVGTCTLITLPSILGRIKLSDSRITFLPGTVYLRFGEFVSTDIEVDETHTLSSTYTLRFVDVNTTDWAKLGRFVKTAPYLGYQYWKADYKTYTSPQFATSGLDIEYPGFDGFNEWIQESAFINRRHRADTPWYVPGEFMAEFIPDAKAKSDGYYDGRYSKQLEFEGYTVSATDTWLSKFHKVAFRFAPVSNPGALSEFFRGIATRNYAYTDELDLIGLQGDLSASFKTIQDMGKLSYQRFRVGSWGTNRRSPYCLVSLRMERCVMEPAHLDTLIGYIAVGLRDDYLLSRVNLLYLNDMGLNDTHAGLILDSLQSRNAAYGGRKPVDLGLRGSRITDASILRIKELLLARRLCLCSLDLDASSYDVAEEDLTWSIDALADYAATAAAQDWCGVMAITVPMRFEDKFHGATMDRLLAMHNPETFNVTDVHITRAERSVRLLDGSDMTSWVWSEFMKRWWLYYLRPDFVMRLDGSPGYNVERSDMNNPDNHYHLYPKKLDMTKGPSL